MPVAMRPYDEANAHCNNIHPVDKNIDYHLFDEREKETNEIELFVQTTGSLANAMRMLSSNQSISTAETKYKHDESEFDFNAKKVFR